MSSDISLDFALTIGFLGICICSYLTGKEVKVKLKGKLLRHLHHLTGKKVKFELKWVKMHLPKSIIC